jgi:hypothetical protein
MLRHKAMIQAARLAFSYVGIYDQDEAERILEATGQAPTGKPTPQGAAMPGNDDAAFAEYEAKHLPAMREAAMKGMSALQQAHIDLPKSPMKTAFWQKHQAELKASAQPVTIDAETGEVCHD